MPKQLEEAQTKLSTVEHQLETAKVEVTKLFAQESELAEMKVKVAGNNVEKPAVKEKGERRNFIKFIFIFTFVLI